MYNKQLIKNLLVAGTFSCVALFGYMNLEPAVAEAVSDDVTVTQAVTSEITITSPTDVTMSPSIAGMSGGTGDGSATWTVKTNDTSGFNMKIKASTSPALASGANSFADYTEASAGVPDYTWSVAAADSEFGYTVEPATATDADAHFKDNGSSTCNTGSTQTADKCWANLTTSDYQIINRTGITSSSGEAEVVKFKAQSGASHFQPEGSYAATVTVTALTN